MTPSGEWLRRQFGTACKLVRRDGLIAACLAGAGAIPLVLLVAWALGRSSYWEAPTPWPLLVLVLGLLAGIGSIVQLHRRWVSTVADTVVAAASEIRHGMPAGRVRRRLALRASLPAGSSPALYHRAERGLVKDLSGATPRDLAGAIGELARRRRQRSLLAISVLVLVTLLLGGLSPDRSRAGWTPLLSPLAVLTPPPLPPLILEPGDVEVPRGTGLDLTVRAEGRREVTVVWQSVGSLPEKRNLELGGSFGVTRIESIDVPHRYSAYLQRGEVSERLEVIPLDPLLLADLVIDLTYPAELGLEDERFVGEVPPLEIPEGTPIEIRGRATRALGEITLDRSDGAGEVGLVVNDDQFAGRWVPTRSEEHTS